MNHCRLWLTKEEIIPEKLIGSIAVVIDVLLATTTLITIMERGAKRVFPVASIDEANRLNHELGGTCITGGEQRGKKIEGFMTGYLPEDFPSDFVKGREIIFLSTNGTRAITSASTADKVLLANLRNAPTIAEYLNAITEDVEVYIICSGSGGHFSLEDFVCASYILSNVNLTNVKFNDAVQIAIEQTFDSKEKIRQIVKKSRVGRRSIQKGMKKLIDFTSDLGASNTIVEYRNGELKIVGDRILHP